MGCGSSHDEARDALNFVSKRYPRLLAFLDLTPYAAQIAKFFERSGREGVGSRVKVVDFLDLLMLNQTRAARRLFAICDFEGTDSLDFREMLFTVWHLATLDDHGLVQTVFELYDQDSDGIMQVQDCVDLITDCYGKGIAADVHVQALIASLKTQGAMSKAAFWTFTKRSPKTLMQIVDMQTRTRQRLLGESVWARIEKKRAAKMDQAFLPSNYAELFAKAVVLDVQAGGKNEKKKTGYEDEEEAAPEAAAERPATPEDNGPGDIVIERATSPRAEDAHLSSAGDKNHLGSGGARRIRGFKGERLRTEEDKAAAAAAAAIEAAAASSERTLEQLASEARIAEWAEEAAADLAERHGVDAGAAVAATKSPPRSHKKSAKVHAIPPPPPLEPETSSSASAASEPEGVAASAVNAGEGEDEDEEHGVDGAAGFGDAPPDLNASLAAGLALSHRREPAEREHDGGGGGKAKGKGKEKEKEKRKKTVYKTNTAAAT